MVSKGRYFLFIEIIFVFLGNSLVRSVMTDVRLVGGPTSNKGTVEIREDGGAWRTTCGIFFTIFDVIVICRQLGFTGASRAIRDTPYGLNSTPAIGELSCYGDEANLTGCRLIHYPCSVAGAASCHGEGYLGCYRDLPNDRVLSGDLLINNQDNMTISYCIEFCDSLFTANYVYAGVVYGNECFCGDASDNYTRHGVGSDFDCQFRCSGDPTESCGGAGYIAVFRIFQPTDPPTTVADTSPTTTTTTTFASASGNLDVHTETLSTVYCQECDCSKEVASTITVGILLAFVTLYGIIITLMHLHLRRSNIALKQSVSDREGQELDPYTSLDASTMKQPVYEDIKATRHGNRGHTNAIEGVEYGNQTIVEQTARVKKSNFGEADENTEPTYELPN